MRARTRYRAWLLAACLVLPGAAAAETARIVPPEVLAAIVDDGPPPLPRSATLEELRLPLPLAQGSAPPAGRILTRPEYAANDGLLIRWGNFNSVLTAMTVAVTTADATTTIWVLVANAAQQASAATTLAGAGADMDQVEFLVRATDSVWIRDYGPRFIEEDVTRAVVDHQYNRPRPLDNGVPDFIAQQWGLAGYDIPLTHGGGNFHLFANGEAFMSDLILAENPGLTTEDVETYFAQYENLDLTIWDALPQSFDSTQHIDMWLLPVRDDVAIVGRYAPTTGAPHTITEAFTAELESRGYTVYRVDGFRSGSTHYTYTNAVISNQLVLVPTYGDYPAENAAALAVFTSAFPDHQIVPVDASQLVHSAGVLHCIVMHVPSVDPTIFADGFESGDTSAWSEIVN